jgi:SAM-dependent methyltransferase
MPRTITERIERYILDGSDEDLKRLLQIAELNADRARAAFMDVGIAEGWRAIDCGCGPLGALAVLAELVGPRGRVIGVDFTTGTVERAREVVHQLGLPNVDVIQADIHQVDAVSLGGLFDVAYTRCFLMHQADPVECLAAIAALIRPGGWIVAQEPLASPRPHAHPALAALGNYWGLMYDVMERSGLSREAVPSLPSCARSAGLEVLRTKGSFNITDPEVGFGVHAASLAAFRDRALASGIASTSEVDGLIAELRLAASSGDYEWVSSPYFLELTLQKPD